MSENNQNINLLEEKEKNVKEEKISNNISITKSIVLHRILNIIIKIVFLYLLVMIIKFIINDSTPDYRPGQASITLLLYILPTIAIIISCISLIYISAIKPRRSREKNYRVKKSTVNKEEFNDIFCEKISKPIIEYAIPNSICEHSNGIPKEIYESMGFSNNHDIFTSTDNIKLKDNSNLMLSKVHTKFKESGSNGYWYSTLFCGIASINTIPFNIPFYIKIRNKSLGSLKLKNTIKLYNNEFNKYYEIETNNIELLNKYFSDKMIMYFIELAKINQRLEINIFQNHIYIRLHNNEFLEFYENDNTNEERIIDSCNSIIAIINTNNFIIDELKSNNI